VLADLALESEAATAFALRVAGAVDRAPRNPSEAAFARVATAIGKYWICKRAPAFVNEAQECLGGAGYVEENILPRLYREAPLNSIWEGCGNIQCLDVLRALSREPGCAEALFAELAPHAELVEFSAPLREAFATPDTLEPRARWLVERLALLLQGAVLLSAGQADVAGAFLRSRLHGEQGLVFGTLSPNIDIAPLLRRVLPD